MTKATSNSLLPFGTMYLTGARTPQLDLAAKYNMENADTVEMKIPLGILVQPITERYLDDGAEYYQYCGIDNGCFTEIGQQRYSDERYFRLIDKALNTFGDDVLFATARDVPFEWLQTLEMSMPVLPKIRALGAPAALVVQDGATPENIPWDDLDCIFIGGSTEWKVSDVAREVSIEAKRRRKWVHMGRVNSMKRMKIAQSFRADSADGTYLLHMSRSGRGNEGSENVLKWLREMWKSDPSRELARGYLYNPSEGRDASEATDNPAFRRWFGDSVVVDESGEPLVVYHGSNAHAYSPGERIEAFNTRPSSGRIGAFFSSDPKLAKQYGERVYDVFLKIQNPLVVYANGQGWTTLSERSQMDGQVTEKVRQEAKRAVAEEEALLLELADLYGEDLSVKQNVFLERSSLRGLALKDLPVGDVPQTTDAVSKAAARLGYDGVIIRDVQDSPTSDARAYSRVLSDIYVVFSPTQIKSATDNEGTFDPENPDVTRNPGRTFIPPQKVADEAAYGLYLRSQMPPSNRCCTAVGLARAKQLKNRQPVSVETLKRMRSYFQRHEVDKRGRNWGVDSKGYQAWLLWGGNSGRDWCNRTLDHLDEG